MSTLRVDNIKSRTGTVVTVPETNTLAVTGIVSVTSSGSITNAGNLTNTGDLSVGGNAQITGVTTISGNLVNTGTFTQSGTFSITDLSVTNNAQVGGALTVTGDLTVNGTTTTIDTVTLSIEDKNIGIGSVTTPSNTTADGGGITIFGGSDGDKTITWERDTGCFEYSEPSKFKGVVETISVGTTYMSGSDMVLEFDVRVGTTFTHTATTDVGIVSFKNMPADTGVANGTTITLIHTQNATGTGNTTGATGLGRVCTVVGYENGAAVVGVTTAALVGSGTTVTLSTTAGDRDFVSFFIQYTGGTNTDATSYQVYATKNGGFRQG
jgi:hypothetical protein